MALIKCPECSGTVSDKAQSCPHCGYMVNPPKEQKTVVDNTTAENDGCGLALTIAGGIIIAVIFLSFM